LRRAGTLQAAPFRLAHRGVDVCGAMHSCRGGVEPALELAEALHEGGRRRPGALDLLAPAADAGGLGAVGLRPDTVPDPLRGAPHLLAARELGEPCRDHIPG